MRTLNPKIIQISQCNQRTLQQTKDQKYDPASKINFMNFDLFSPIFLCFPRKRSLLTLQPARFRRSR